MPIQLRTLDGKVPKDVELTLRDLIAAVNRLEAEVAALRQKAKE